MDLDYLRVRTVIDPATGCWIWLKGKTQKGYGTVTGWDFKAKKVRGYLAHRLAFQFATGITLRPREVVAHSCDTPSCINPAHLERSTPSRNEYDKVARGRHHQAKKTHCIHGHALSGRNLIVRTDGRGRNCRECGRTAQARYHSRGAGLDLGASLPSFFLEG
jgi:hypothetical protein